MDPIRTNDNGPRHRPAAARTAVVGTLAAALAGALAAGCGGAAQTDDVRVLRAAVQAMLDADLSVRGVFDRFCDAPRACAEADADADDAADAADATGAADAADAPDAPDALATGDGDTADADTADADTGDTADPDTDTADAGSADAADTTDGAGTQTIREAVPESVPLVSPGSPEAGWPPCPWVQREEPDAQPDGFLVGFTRPVIAADTASLVLSRSCRDPRTTQVDRFRLQRDEDGDWRVVGIERGPTD